MVIVVFLSDVKTGKDMIIATVRPKDKISVVMKKVEGKLGMKQAQMDWWTIAEKDRIRAKKAKDPKSLLLEKKMDPKMTFGDYGIDSDTCVYAKKKGAPPNDPTASPAATPKAAPPAPQPAPPKAAPPAPPPPKEPEPAPQAPPSPTPASPAAAPLPPPPPPPPPAGGTAVPSPNASPAAPPSPTPDPAVPSPTAKQPPPAPRAAAAAPRPASKEQPPAASPPPSAQKGPLPQPPQPHEQHASPQQGSRPSGQVQRPDAAFHTQSAGGVREPFAGEKPPVETGTAAVEACQRALQEMTWKPKESELREQKWGMLLDQVDRMKLEREAEREAHARLLQRERLQLCGKAEELKGIHEELNELTRDALAHVVSGLGRHSALPQHTGAGSWRSGSGLSSGQPLGHLERSRMLKGIGASMAAQEPHKNAALRANPYDSHMSSQQQPLLRGSSFQPDLALPVVQRLERLSTAVATAEQELASYRTNRASDSRMPAGGGGVSPPAASHPPAKPSTNPHHRHAFVDPSYFDGYAGPPRPPSRFSPAAAREQRPVAQRAHAASEPRSGDAYAYAAYRRSTSPERVENLTQQMMRMPLEQGVTEGEVNEAFVKMLHLRMLRDKAMLSEMEATNALQGLGVAAAAVPTVKGTASVWNPQTIAGAGSSPLRQSDAYGSPSPSPPSVRRQRW